VLGFSKRRLRNSDLDVIQVVTGCKSGDSKSMTG
jgi:hypothetical protein